MRDKALILCVDDEPVNLTIMEELLQDNYVLNTAKSGEGCLEQVAVQMPDLILLDVNMPNMDGLETCKQLRAAAETAEIPIIFVSALASQEELMAGYEAGGDDYITKPFSEEILQKKIEIVLESQRRKRELKSISDKAVADLMNNLSHTEELGVVVRFLNRIQNAANLDELAQSVFDCLREYELDSSLLFLAEPENRVWFSDDINRPMESQILESLRGQDRVVRFGTRLAINSDHATILVRNLPSEEGSVERLREHLAIMTEALDARIYALETSRLLDERREILARVLAATRDKLGQIEDLQQQRKTRSGEIIEVMGTELERSLIRLDLSKAQEDALAKIVRNTSQKVEALFDEGASIDEQFADIIDVLSGALNE